MRFRRDRGALRVPNRCAAKCHRLKFGHCCLFCGHGEIPAQIRQVERVGMVIACVRRAQIVCNGAVGTVFDVALTPRNRWVCGDWPADCFSCGWRIRSPEPHSGGTTADKRKGGNHMPSGLTDTEKAQAALFMREAIPHFSDATKGKGAYMRAGIKDAWSQVFPNVDFRLACDELKADKVLDVMPVRGGVIVFLWNDRPDSLKNRDAQMEKAQSFAQGFTAKITAPAVAQVETVPPVVVKETKPITDPAPKGNGKAQAAQATA